MAKKIQEKKVIIIGAGMAGCFMAYLLGQKGYSIDVFEYRDDVRKKPYESGRSFNITLYYRGLVAMKKVGVWDAIKPYSVIAEGNVAHYSDKNSTFSPFDTHGNEILYTVHRNQLNSALINIADKLPNVKFHFNTKVVSIDRSTKTLRLQRSKTLKADLIIGADGINSIVRQTIQQNGQTVRHTQEYEDWGYKEVHISKSLGEKMNIRTRATHTWPRDNSLLIAFPNPDDSFTLMFNLPLAGKNGFSELNSEKAITAYITKNFPDLLPLLSEIKKSFLQKPTGSLSTIWTDPWYYKDGIVLLGDAAHGFTPFYGQGVCAALEDCILLDKLLAKETNWEKAFEKYQNNRKRNTDVLGHLAKENFIELRDKSRSAFYLVKDKADTLLNRLFPKFWLPPLYVLIAHGTQDYADAYESFKKQKKISRLSGLDLLIFFASLPIMLSRKLTHSLK